MRRLLASVFCGGLLGWATAPARAQAVAPADTSHQVIIGTGKPKPAFLWSLPPGDGYALRFAPPAGQHQVVSIRLHFQAFGQRVAKGQVRLRLARVAATGAPAEDSLLAQPVLISEYTLQTLDHPLVLTWPAERIVVPPAGFFLMLEGVGQAPDEYVMHSPRVVLAGAGNSHIGRRSQPTAPPRLLSTWSIPSLLGARAASTPLGLWAKGGEVVEWRAYPEGKQLPLLEIGFK
ncbi:hypothetical protein [Hymenobacter cheonanensis]|uniref:hypothetical protein n=1 Tax=Hymenobacter sp. CA2-7 TaxID=3063993 RepID=UPI002712FEB4|nr:hypothetical protein [Hymenobacter sp. CA2-7]MDO7888090.1 hypothetical protein [Hymenobacter sp. CA2-7]